MRFRHRPVCAHGANRNIVASPSPNHLLSSFPFLASLPKSLVPQIRSKVLGVCALASITAALGLSGCAAVVLVPVVAGVGGASKYGDEIFGSPPTPAEAVDQAKCPPAGSSGSNADNPVCLAKTTVAEGAPAPASTEVFGPPRSSNREKLYAALTVPENGEKVEDGWAEPALDEYQPDDADVSEEAAPAPPPAEPSNTPADNSATPDNAADDEPPGISRVYMVRKGDTLLGILTNAGMPRAQAVDAIDASRAVYDPRDLIPGQKVTIVYQPRPNGRRVVYDLYAFTVGDGSDGGVTVVRHSGDRFEARETARSGQGRMIHVLARFDQETSLFESGVAAGIPANLLLELIRLYSWDVDFERNVQPGDSLDVVFTNQAYAGTDAENGLLYSMLTLGGKAYRLYRFEVEPRRFEFFNERGFSAQTPLMRTPVQGAEFSSGFGRRKTSRYSFTRMHRGVDFRAPIGSPIYAAGDGTIERATFHRGYGYYIKIRHSSGHSTLYAHMQRPRKPLKVGAAVRQGDVIGHVGMTGRTTGPHLHYEIHVNGVQVDPLTIKLASRRALSGHMLRSFQAARDALDREIAQIPAVARVAQRTAR